MICKNFQSLKNKGLDIKKLSFSIDLHTIFNMVDHVIEEIEQL